MGDPGQLRQVFVNLLANAVQAIGDRGEVRILGSLHGDAAEIVIEDTGPGVAEAIRKRLFEPLMTTRAKGIGLGLALVKRIVERHHGTIVYDPGQSGARFVLRLPIAG
jgi:signal transduction histidine kinase